MESTEENLCPQQPLGGHVDASGGRGLCDTVRSSTLGRPRVCCGFEENKLRILSTLPQRQGPVRGEGEELTLNSGA